MRYIIYGAGAVGGTIGARLALAGKDVVLICRGEHYAAIRENGLHFRTPEQEHRIPIAVVSHPRELTFKEGDAVILSMKTQHTAAALDDLEQAAGTDVPVICAQNGVENERMAARRFARVYAMLVNLPGTMLTPGVVDAEGTPLSGVLHTGCYPGGVDTTITQVAADIASSHFRSDADPKVLRIKYAKLLQNLVNACDVVMGWAARSTDEGKRLVAEIQAEGARVLEAAGIEYAPDSEVAERVRAHYRAARVAGADGARSGSSTLQSILRGHTSIEVDYLNGEIALLGKLHGVPTPYNSVMRREANRIAATGAEPGSVSAADVAALVEAASR